MDETELIELEDEITGESDTHTLKKEDFTFDISVSIKYCWFLKISNIKNSGQRSCYVQKSI